MNYLRARYYDPTTAQFTSLDPAVTTTRSPYAYTLGNPLNATDPTGLDCSWNPFDSNSCEGQAVGSAWNDATGAVSTAWNATAGQVVNNLQNNVWGACVNVGWQNGIFTQGNLGTGTGFETCANFNLNGVGITDTVTSYKGFNAGIGVNLQEVQAHNPGALQGKGQIVGCGRDILQGDLLGDNGGNVTGAEFGVGVGVPGAVSAYSGTTSTDEWGVNWH